VKTRIYKSIILLGILHGYETWFPTLREVSRLRVLESRVLRIILGGWRRLRNGELHNLYSLPSNIKTMESRRMRLAEHVTRMRGKMNAYTILMGKPEGKKQ
jgi:hypothetical protein